MKHSPSPLPDNLLSRAFASHAVGRIITGKESLEKLLEGLYKEGSMTARDKGFAEYILRASVKGYPRYARLVQGLLREPFTDLPLPARTLLITACVQLHEMDVPAYAAVNSTVELAKRYRLPHLAGMINAVLKRASTLSLTGYPLTLDDAPEWLRTRLIKDYGETEALAIFTASMEDVQYVDITIKHLDTLTQWQALLGATHLMGQCVRVRHAGNITHLAGFEEGAWWVQDMAASIPLFLMQPLLKGRSVLDLCAAPGGKAMQLASYGAEVVAVDRSTARLHTLQENLQRTGLHVTCMTADSSKADFTPADIVVVDAPCSATGTLRRHPDILYQRTQQDITQLVQAQRALLLNAAQHTTSQGYMLYLVCSLFTEEGEQQVTWFLDQHPAWERVDFRTLSPMAHALPPEIFTPHGAYRAQPTMCAAQGGMDGLFAALLRHKG